MTSGLGDLLVLLHDAAARSEHSTVRAMLRSWHDVAAMSAALQRWAERGGGTAYALGPGPGSDTVETVVRVWIAPPDRIREERENPDGRSFGVRVGDTWWRYDPQQGAVSNEGRPEIGSGMGEELRAVLDPAPVMGALEFGAIRPSRIAGRDALHVRATPRVLADGGGSPLFRVGAMGADELLLDVDAERGALLRVESRFEQRPIALQEVVEIAFDERLADELFVFAPPAGEEVRPFASCAHIRRDLTIDEAVALAPFTVWVPARVPAGWEITIAFAAEEDRPPVAPYAFLHYRSPDGLHGFSLTESPADRPADAEAEGPGGPWRDAEHDRRRMQVREPAETWQPAQVRLELDGTRILIHSNDLEVAALADVAAGLVPAPGESPEL